MRRSQTRRDSESRLTNFAAIHYIGVVFFRKKPPENLFYAYPDSPEGSRARYFRNLKWSFVVGGLIATVLGSAIYFLNKL